MTSRILFFSLLVFVLAGCVSPPPQVRLQIAGGERIMVDLRNGEVIGASYDGFKTRLGGLITNAEKQAIYTFIIEFKPGDTPRSIKVEDLTDQKPQLFVDDQQPTLKNSLWLWSSPSMKADHSDLSWLHEIDDCFRVYRITVVMADGRRFIHVRAYVYPAWIKARFRKELGIDS